MRLVSTLLLSLTCALTACAGADPTESEGGGGGSDGGGNTGPRSVSVQIIKADNSPAGAADVIFHDASGAVLSHIRTGSDGLASDEGDIDAVSIVDPAGSVTTFFDVEDGAVIKLRLLGNSGEEARGSMRMNFPQPGPDNVYIADNSCGSGAAYLETSITIPVTTRCVSPANTVDVYATRSPNATGEITGYSFKKDVVHAGGTTMVAMPGWATDLAESTIALSNAPDNTLAAGLDFLMVRNYHVVDPAPVAPRWYPMAAGETRSRSLRYGQGFADDYLYQIAAYFGTSEENISGYSGRLDRPLSLPQSETLSGSELLPEIYQVSSDLSSVRRPEVSFSTRSPMTRADAGVVLLTWPGGRWEGIFPVEHPSPIIMPALPDALALYRPSTDLDPAIVYFKDDSAFDGRVFDADYFRYGPRMGEHTLTTVGGVGQGVSRVNGDPRCQDAFDRGSLYCQTVQPATMAQ